MSTFASPWDSFLPNIPKTLWPSKTQLKQPSTQNKFLLPPALEALYPCYLSTIDTQPAPSPTPTPPDHKLSKPKHAISKRSHLVCTLCCLDKWHTYLLCREKTAVWGLFGLKTKKSQVRAQTTQNLSVKTRTSYSPQQMLYLWPWKRWL